MSVPARKYSFFVKQKPDAVLKYVAGSGGSCPFITEVSEKSFALTARQPFKFPHVQLRGSVEPHGYGSVVHYQLVGRLPILESAAIVAIILTWAACHVWIIAYHCANPAEAVLVALKGLLACFSLALLLYVSMNRRKAAEQQLVDYLRGLPGSFDE